MMVEIEKEIKKVSGHHKASQVGRTLFFPSHPFKALEHQNLFQDNNSSPSGRVESWLQELLELIQMCRRGMGRKKFEK